MKKLELTDFEGFRFLSGLSASPGGTRAAFAVHTMDLESNKYLSNIFLFDTDSKVRQLSDTNEEKSLIWTDSTTILFATSRDKDVKDKKEAKQPITCYYKLDVDTMKSSKAFTLPLDVSFIEHLEGNKYLLLASFDRRIGNTWGVSQEELDKKVSELKEENDYEVLDEIPFWSNGDGFTNKRRTRLFVYDGDKNQLIPVTDEFTNVDNLHVNPSKEKALIVTTSYIDKMGMNNQIMQLDLVTLRLDKISPIQDFLYDFAGYLKDMIVFVGKGMKNYGLNEIPKVYLTEDEGLSYVKLCDLKQDIYNSVGSDSRYGFGKSFQIDGDHLYFISTLGYSSNLYRIGLEGLLERLTNEQGSVDEFDVSNGQVYIIAMRQLQLQELYSVSNRDETMLTSFNLEVLKDKSLSIPEAIVFHNDDIELTGWVMKPCGYDVKEKYPAILNIHGGPKTVYGTVYSHEIQYWANKGFFVFFMNPRGSDGYGDKFADIRGKYGTIDYEDLMVFTDKVLDSYPAIDKFRIGVTGGSYGGFMTNWIIGHTNRFKAAVSQRSISNWISFFGTSDIGYYFTDDQNTATPWSSYRKLWEHSPLKYADKVQTPTLFIHSEEDYRCWLAEGLQMYTALKYHGVVSRLVLFKGENHDLSRTGKPKHRVRRLQEITEWFEKYLSN
jgi:dipeptidyl aminopeptidase/acylaminoacyl peptidase